MRHPSRSSLRLRLARGKRGASFYEAGLDWLTPPVARESGSGLSFISTLRAGCGCAMTTIGQPYVVIAAYNRWSFAARASPEVARISCACGSGFA